MQKIVYFDNKISEWQKKLELPNNNSDFLKPLIDKLTWDPVGDWKSPVLEDLPRIRDPLFKKEAGWSIRPKGLVDVSVRGTSYSPCFVSDQIKGISVSPTFINIAPYVIATTAEGINVGPTLINVAPNLIHINPKGLDSSPKMIDINPRIIQVSPSVGWAGVPVPETLGKPDRKRPSDPPPGQ